LCDQEEETIQHLLTGCVFAQQVWFSILSPLGLGSEAPGHNDLCFADWWAKIIRMFSKEHRKGANSFIILIAWCYGSTVMHVFFMETPLLLVSFCDSLKMSISFGATPELRNFMRSDWIGWELLDESLPCCLVVKSIFRVTVL